MAKKHRKVQAEQITETPVVETSVQEAPAQETSNEAPVQETPVEAKPVKVRYAKRDWAATDIITLNTPNPKSGKSKERYELYVTGMSVSEYAQAVVMHGGSKTLANADLRWDVARNFISISPKAE